MARKWSTLNLPGALHYFTGNFLNRLPVFTEDLCCQAFIDELRTLNQVWPSILGWAGMVFTKEKRVND